MYIEVDETRHIDISKAYVREKSKYLQQTKKTLLIFRRMSNKKAKCTLELRHQRTCDVCFDWAVVNENSATLQNDPINNDGISRSPNFTPNNYVYKMIETMLPKNFKF